MLIGESAMDGDDFEDLFNTCPTDDDGWPMDHGGWTPSTRVEHDTVEDPVSKDAAVAHDAFSSNMWSPPGSDCGEVTLAEVETPVHMSEQSTDMTMPPSAARKRPDALALIETIFEEMMDVLLNERGQMGITLKHRPRTSTKGPPHAAQDVTQRVEVERRLCFPGRTETEAWRFTVVTRILELVHEALRSETVLSKRDIYYRDPALFNKQSTVDRYVDDIAYTFGAPRAALNVAAVAKGLILGAVTFNRSDGSSMSAAADAEGILVPSLRDVLSVDLSSIAWILVIEKEATFRSIAASPFWQQHAGHGMLVTAKGYPDIATRALLQLLSTPTPENAFASPPVYGLVDFDPDGLAIFTTYKHGSLKVSNEYAGLKLPGMQWLGLRSSALSSGDSIHASQGLLTLTPRDRKRARLMLGWGILQDENEMRAELQTMLMLGCKAELQLLDASPDGMAKLLTSALPAPGLWLQCIA